MSEEQQLVSDTSAISSVERVMERVVHQASAMAIFGQPVQRSETIVIPCADVVMGMGIGSGSGAGIENGPHQRLEGPKGGAGAGGGSGMRGRPVAAIVITPSRVYVDPIVDVTRIALAALATAGFVVYWLTHLKRGAERGEKHAPSPAELRRAVHQ